MILSRDRQDDNKRKWYILSLFALFAIVSIRASTGIRNISDLPYSTTADWTARKCLSSGIVHFSGVDRTWSYPSSCIGLAKFDYPRARKSFVFTNASIFFLGNSVSRRLLYSVAHIIGGPNARTNADIHAAERLQDVGSHGIFEVSVDYQGHCSGQRTCVPSPLKRSAGLICANETAWNNLRSPCTPCAHLGFAFTSTPVLSESKALVNAC